MDFGTLLHAAKRNENSVKKEIKCYKATFDPPKKEQKSKSLSANIQKFLARKEEEEKQKVDKAKKKKDDLLALRSQDGKAKKRVAAMLNRTKAANKSAIADAVDNENTAVTLGGLAQPDEDDYGYVSQEATAFYAKLMEKYTTTPSDEPKFSKKSLLKSSVADLNNTKDRVRMALLREEEEELLPHKRKRKPKEEKLRESEGGSKSQGQPDYEETNYEDEKPERPVKSRRPAPPPMDFSQLLKIAEKKQFEPIKIEPKVKEEDEDERPMTKKQRVEYLKEKEWRMRKEGKLPPLTASKSTSGQDQRNNRPQSSEERNRDQRTSSRPSTDSSKDQRNNRPSIEGQRDQRNNRPTSEGYRERTDSRSVDTYREQMSNRSSINGSRENLGGRSSMNGFREQTNNRPSMDGYREQTNNRPSMDGYREQTNNRPSMDGYREQTNNRPSMDGYREQTNNRPSMDGYREQMNNRPSMDGYREQTNNRPSGNGNKDQRVGRSSGDEYREQRNVQSMEGNRNQKNNRSLEDGNSSSPRIPKANNTNRIEKDERSQHRIPKLNGSSKSSVSNNSNSGNKNVKLQGNSDSKVGKERSRDDFRSNPVTGKPPLKTNHMPSASASGQGSVNRNSIEQRKGASTSGNSKNYNLSSYSKKLQESLLAKLQEKEKTGPSRVSESNKFRIPEDPPPKSSKNRDSGSFDMSRVPKVQSKPTRSVEAREMMRKEGSLLKNSSRQLPVQRADESPRGTEASKPQESLQRIKSGQIPARDMVRKPNPMSKDIKSRQFPPSDVKPRQFPPPDVRPRQFPPADVRRKPKPPTKRRIEDSDEEYDSELDDFIDDGPEDSEDYSKHIKEIFGYDKSRYRDVEDGDECMESSFSQQLKEEFVSTKMGILEDLEDMEMEKREIAQKKKITTAKKKRR